MNKTPPNTDLSRRNLFATATSIAFGAAVVSACGRDPGEPEPSPSADVDAGSAVQLGSLETPLTQDTPGAWAEGKETRNPQIFANLISSTAASSKVTRVWIEVLGAASEAPSKLSDLVFDVLSTERLCSDGVTEIRLVDVDTNTTLASKTLDAAWQPRFISEVIFPASVKNVAAYAYIKSRGGWWRGATAAVSDLQVYLPPKIEKGALGGFRQPLTRFNPGFLDVPNANDVGDLAAYKDLKHQGHWHKFGRGGLRFVFADFNDTAESDATRAQAHGDWSDAHYLMGAYVFDQNDQLIANTPFTWGDNTSESFATAAGVIPERKTPVTTAPLNLGAITKDTPYITFPNIPEGVSRIRIIWLCNVDGWWESSHASI